jgi:rod shape-determining protein MreB
LATGLPKSIRVNSSEIREALVPVINQIITAISDIIEETPPELLGDITQRGVYLSGGGSLIEGLPVLINESIGIPCCLVEDPLSCVARGCAKVLSDEKMLNKVKVRGGVR